MSFSQFTNKPIPEVFENLKTSSGGLSSKEALLRQQEYGLNEIKDHKNTALDILLRQAKSPFFYLLLAAGFVSLFIGERLDSAVILACVAINIIIGFFQEFRAERAVSLLQKLIPQKIHVMREARQDSIEKKDLVPGDVVLLSAGDIVPAELRVVESEGLLVDESALTGESMYVSKTHEPLPKEEQELFRAQNILFAGTVVAGGNAKGVVVAIGQETQLGKIATLVQAPEPQSAYQKNILYFCRLILKIVLATVLLVFILNFVIKGTANTFEFLLFCVALLVSILPEALPAIVILALSGGSLKMAKDKVVVKRLSSIEDLGNIEILCSDKTGTLTENKLSLEKIISSYKDKALLYALVGAGKTHNLQNPFETAFFERAPYDLKEKLKDYKVISHVTFDSFRMRTSYLVEDKKGEKIIIVKGAPEVLVGLCTGLNPSAKKEIKEDVAKEGSEGKRVLAVAFKRVNRDVTVISKEDEKQLTMLGYFVFQDPLKKTAEDAVRMAKKLGVVVKIVTGDSAEVSGYIAKQVGLITSTEKVMLGQDLQKLSQEEFDNACLDNMVFARVSPEVKHRIIQSLQKRHEVGFLGEGINDAPALKTADVGIVVAGAADIARESADIVLLQKDLKVIILGIKHGRVIFANINKYIKCTLASNFGNFYSTALVERRLLK